MKAKDDFISCSLDLIKDANYNDEEIKAYLEACWLHGASTAFYLPALAYEAIGNSGRKVYARLILNYTLIERFKKEVHELTEEEEEAAEDYCLELESHLPLMRIDIGDDLPWIVGERSTN